MKVRIVVSLKDGVLDPQGRAVKEALNNLGFDEVVDVRVGKVIDIELDADRVDNVEELVSNMCSKLLVNPVIEKYELLEVKK